MADRWLVRVGEKEYGPVELGTLDDWKREGRLLPTNEVRRESDSVWATANTIPELFGPPPLPVQTGHPLVRRRSFGEIIDRKSTRLNSSHRTISYAVFCLKKKNEKLTPYVIVPGVRQEQEPYEAHYHENSRAWEMSERDDGRLGRFPSEHAIGHRPQQVLH